MSTSKFEVEKFDGKNDFSLWRAKMMAHMGNLGCEETLQEESKMAKLENKAEVLKKAKNTIILSLNDQVLMKVIKEESS